MDSCDCPVCFVVYDDPRCLPCGHSFCLKCIKQIAGYSRNLECPCCKINVALGVAGAEGLLKNYSLSTVIQNIPSSMCCSEHKKSFDMFCAECNVTICCKCIFGSHSGHKIEDIDVVFNERKGIIANHLESTKLWQLKIKEETDATLLARLLMQGEADNIKSTINDSFMKWHDVLERQRHILIDLVDEETGKRMKALDDNMSICERANAAINNLTTSMNKTLLEDKASVVQQLGPLTERYEKVRKETMQDGNITFIKPDDLKIAIRAPWIEESVENIKLIDTRQTEDSSMERTISSIIEENQILTSEMGDMKLRFDPLRNENIQLKQNLEETERGRNIRKKKLDEMKQMIANILHEDEKYYTRIHPTPELLQLLCWRRYITQHAEELEMMEREENLRRTTLSELQAMVSKILEEDEKKILR